MAWTRALDLEHWADKIDARHQLPGLIRKLARRTLQSWTVLNFPAAEQVGNSGFDGLIETDQGNEFVPTGRSAWEMGVGDPGTKANEDFKKRTEKTPGDERAKTTFTFVTPRKWPGKDKWIAEKKKKPEWLDVKVLDANDLEHWLEAAPAVDIWFARLTGKPTDGAEDLSAYWTALRSISDPPLSPKVFLESREREIESIAAWLSLEPDSLFLQTGGFADGLDFMAALAESGHLELMSDALIVDKKDTWRELADSKESLVLLPAPSLQLEAAEISRAVQNGHYVLVSGPRGIVANEKAVKLSRQDHYRVQEALIETGFDESIARSKASASCGSSTILKRQITQHPATVFPAWANDEHRSRLALFALAGGWVDVDPEPPPRNPDHPWAQYKPPQDVLLITKLIGCDRIELDELVRRWEQVADPLFIHFRDTVLVTSREDAWYLLGGAISAAQLKKFQDLAILILDEDNPKFELDVDQEWMAGIHGKTSSLSEELRKSIVQTLALMAAYEPMQSTGPKVDFKGAIRTVLERALPKNATWQRWASLDHNLTVIAEADPQFLLSRIEEDLNADSPALPELFKRQPKMGFGGSLHVHLLWALESLAWSPKYLSRSAVVLAKLARHVAGIKTNANRPENSLEEIFLLWLPHTNAPPPQRIAALRDVLKSEPIAGWNLLFEILPGGPKSYSTNTHMPRWQPWAEGWSRDKVHSEFYEYGMAIADLAFEEAGKDLVRWAHIVERMFSFNEEVSRRAINVLTEIADHIEASQDTAPLWTKIRNLIARHERYSEAEWSFDADILSKMTTICDKLAPSDPVAINHWLFDWHPNLTDIDAADDFTAYQTALQSARDAAVREVATKCGADGIIRLAKLASVPNVIGWIVAQENLIHWEEFGVPATFDSGDQNTLSLLAGYFSGAFHRDQWKFIESIPTNSWTPNQIAMLACCLPYAKDVWEWLAKQGEEVEDAYWKLVKGMLYKIDFESVQIAAASLLAASRPFEMIRQVQLWHSEENQLPTEFVASILELALRSKDSDLKAVGSDVSYSVQQLIGLLQKDATIDRIRLGHIEWGYLPMLERSFSQVGPNTLYAAIGDDPEFFITILKLVYRGKDEKPGTEPKTEFDRRRAQQAYQLIEDVDFLPGTGTDGAIDHAKLSAWIGSVRKLAADCDRLTVCDLTLGKIIATASKDGSKEPEPEHAVAKLMEEIGTDELFRGFVNGAVNSVGVTTRKPLDGGKIEHARAERYRTLSDAFRIISPKLSDAYTVLADSYEADAQREDERAERERYGR